MNHIIYLPGFGDRYDTLRRFVLHRWENDRTRVLFMPMNWTDKHETYEQKYQRVAHSIHEIDDGAITLIGESAGGAMALYAFSKHTGQIDQVVTICGYNHGAADVHLIHKYQRPAFYHLMPHADRIVENLTAKSREKITTIYSTHDRVVTPAHSRIKGVKEVIIHTPGHFIPIAQVLIKKTPLKLLK